MNGISNLYPAFLRRFYGMHIGANVRISYKAKLDKSINPKGIHIGDNTWVLADSMVLRRDVLGGGDAVRPLGRDAQLFLGRPHHGFYDAAPSGAAAAPGRQQRHGRRHRYGRGLHACDASGARVGRQL